MLLLGNKKSFLRQKTFAHDRESIINKYEEVKESVKKNVKVLGPVIEPIKKHLSL